MKTPLSTLKIDELTPEPGFPVANSLESGTFYGPTAGLIYT